MTPNPTSTAAGIDVAKGHLDVATYPTGKPFRVPNTPDGFADLIARLGAVRLVALEATGGYEVPAVSALQVAAVSVAVVNPRQARDFARVIHRHAKTDAVDARVLAEFAARIDPPVAPPAGPRPGRPPGPPPAGDRDAGDGVQPPPPGPPGRGLGRHPGPPGLVRRPATADAELAAAVRRSPAWRAADDLLRSIPGSGR